MFDALSHQLMYRFGLRKTLSCIRQELVAFIASNREITDRVKYVMGQGSAQKYLDDMKSDGCWGDGVMLAAASLHYNTIVSVCLLDNSEMNIGNDSSDGQIVNRRITVGFVPFGSNSIPNHYVSLVDVESVVTQAQDTQTQVDF